MYLVSENRLKRMREVLSKRQKDLRVFVEEVKNEHNFSAIIRTCDAVGVLYIHYFYRGEELPINRGISLGSEKWVFLCREDDPIGGLKRLKREGYKIFATYISPKSKSFLDVDYTKPSVIVLGNEYFGVSKGVLEVADEHIMIPMVGMAQSLNVSVANAVILYEAFKQRLKAGMYDKPTLNEEEFNEILKLWAHYRIINTTVE